MIRDKLNRNFQPRTELSKLKILLDDGADYHTIAFLYNRFMDSAVDEIKSAERIIRRYYDRSMSLGSNIEIEAKILDSFTQK